MKPPRRPRTRASSTSGCGYLRRDLLVARHRSDESSSRGKLIQTFRDKNGDHFDSGRSYRLHVPADPPVSGRLVVDALRQRNAFDGLEPDERCGPLGVRRAQTYTDGSLDLYFGPDAPDKPAEKQLDRDSSRQGILPDVPLLRPPAHCSTARGRYRTSSHCDAHRHAQSRPSVPFVPPQTLQRCAPWIADKKGSRPLPSAGPLQPYWAVTSSQFIPSV